MKLACVLLLTALVFSQNCSDLYIEAIFPCTFSFNLDSTCSFKQCNTQSPGNPQNFTDWSTCYLKCCPGFIDSGLAQTKPSLSSCYNQFISIPTVCIYLFQLVPVIGGILALIAFIICVIVPCCIHSECLLYKIRKECCAQNEEKDEGEMKRLQSFEEERRQEKMKTEEKSMKLAMERIGGLFDIKQDSNFGPQQVCCLCGRGEANSRTACLHAFHLDCLTREKRQSCPACREPDFTPIRNFCRRCFKKYQLYSSLNKESESIVCADCRKQ